MLFDLKGKRRRTVQWTYAGLAFLMAAGLVGFGIGSGTNGGGLSDLFSGGSGKSNANSIVDKRIKTANTALGRNPRDTVALASLVRSHYTLASADTNQNTGVFGKDGKKELALASSAWDRYLAANPKKPDPSLASVMLNAYGTGGLKRPAGAAGAAEVMADARGTAQAYLSLEGCATLAHQTRKAQLAGQKAVALAPKAQLKAVKQYVKDATTVAKAPQFCGQ
jgi:hypothetical protein